MERSAVAPTARLTHGFSRLGSAGGIVVATALLFVVSPLLASNVLSHSSIMSMLPFAAVLALAAAGQTLVVQQGGIDLSVAGTMSLAVAIVTTYPAGDGGRLGAALALVLAATLVSGLLTGLAVTTVGLSPIVATLGVNAVLLGVNVRITSGSPTTAPGNLTDFVAGRTLGVPNTVVLAGVVICVTCFLVKRTTAGRRFEAVGSSPVAARAAGLPVRRYTMGAYVMASVLYGAAGVLLAGFVRVPAVNVGDEYLLPSIAAVVIGGTSLLGGRGNVVASGFGALFLTQLDQVTLAMGVTTAVQTVIQAVIIALGMLVQLLPSLLSERRQRRQRRPPQPRPSPPSPPRLRRTSAPAAEATVSATAASADAGAEAPNLTTYTQEGT